MANSICIPWGRPMEIVAMCDYSLQSVATRPAKVGDRLVTARFANSLTRGFSAIGEPNTAVCLVPGTEIAFDNDIEFEGGLGYYRIGTREKKIGTTVARFRQVDTDKLDVHHDALELPDGQIVLLTRLVEGQFATVLQLPAAPQKSAQKQNTLSIDQLVEDGA
jgi:hypothetical protein